MRSTASGKLRSDEREWIARIEERRRALATDDRLTEPEFHSGEPPQHGLWADLHRPGAISAAAPRISVTPLWGLLLLRIVRELSPGSCVELGTGFGISGCYQAAALELNEAGSLTTLEGAADWAAVASQGFADLGLGRVEVRAGPLAETLEPTLEAIAPVDFAFVDAEHGEAATLFYFRTLLPHLASGAVVVFDDISFTREMLRAWGTIRRHGSVSLAVNLLRVGIVVIARHRAPGA